MTNVEWYNECSCCGMNRKGEVQVAGELIIVTECDGGLSYALHAISGSLTNHDSSVVQGGFAYGKLAADLEDIGIRV